MQEVYELSGKNMATARRIMDELDVPGAWASIGAQANLIGSIRTGLMVKNRDMDYHIYSDRLDKAESFRAASLIASNPRVFRAEFTDLIDTDEQCIEWHAWYRADDGEVWQIDMIHILRGSFFDGYMERVADRITEVLTPETRDAILRIKYDTPDDLKFPAIEVYRAVIEGGARDYDGFIEWRGGTKPSAEVTVWVP